MARPLPRDSSSVVDYLSMTLGINRHLLDDVGYILGGTQREAVVFEYLRYT
jgi:hypothetical protein